MRSVLLFMVSILAASLNTAAMAQQIDWQKVDETFGRKAAVSGDVLDCRQHTQRALSAIERGQWDQAEGDLRQAVHFCPIDCEARRHGRCLKDEHHAHESEEQRPRGGFARRRATRTVSALLLPKRGEAIDEAAQHEPRDEPRHPHGAGRCPRHDASPSPAVTAKKTSSSEPPGCRRERSSSSVPTAAMRPCETIAMRSHSRST